MKITIELLLLIILLFIGALTAASETAIIAASIIKLRRLAADGSKSAKIVLKILETPEKFFGTILVANNIVDALIASIVTVIIISFIGQNSKSIICATIIASFLIIVFEVAAKTLSAKNPVRISLSLAGMVRSLIVIFSPAVRILSVITNFIVSLLGGGKGKPSLVVEDEIKALIRIGEEESPKLKDKYKMLTKVFEFSNTVVKTVMVPKDKMISIDMNTKIEDILDKVLESGYSRLPVHKDNPDNIIGVINMKDLLNLSVNRDLVILEDILYPPIFVPDSKNVAELLKEFQKGHAHLAIVIDSYGKIQGLVTMEDLFEEIVGEIEDEHDIRKKSKKINAKI